MRCRGFGVGLISLVAAFVLTPSAAWAQVQSGVAVDAEGVFRTKMVADPGGQLMKERIAAAKATLPQKVSAYSKTRYISLNRLEQAIVDRQGAPSDEMRYLAGLLRVRYVFYYPDSQDIVLAGPAEGWAPDPASRMVGITSGRPVVQLQDLVVALRAFPPGGSGAQLIGCSIDPTKEGQAALKQFLQSNRPDPSQLEPFVQGLRTSLGYQRVTIHGVPPTTHFAQVLVEADYRMKLMSIELERPPIKLISYAEAAARTGSGHNTMARFYFVPDYQCVRQSEDKLAMELVGDGVKLVGEDELVSAGGERHATGHANKGSQMFTSAFTKHYPELAERSPVYAELRNLIDLSVTAACIHEQDFYGKAGWKMAFFGDEQAFSVETYDMPKTVEAAVNALWKGRTLTTPIGGGVEIKPTQALVPANLLNDEKGKVGKLHETVKPNLAKGQWWWD